MNVDIEKTDRKYNIIYCDPPWPYGKRTGIEGEHHRHYASMSMDELIEMGEKVKRIAADDCALIMWLTYPKIDHIFTAGLLKAWGFKYKTVFQHWTKVAQPQWPKNADEKDPIRPRRGIGYYTKSNGEWCLIATKGSIIKFKKDTFAIPNVIMEPPREHSRKPDITRTHIEQLYGDIPRIELFARQGFPGWDYWGNQTDKFDAVTIPTEIADIYKVQEENVRVVMEEYNTKKELIKAKKAQTRLAKKRKAEEAHPEAPPAKEIREAEKDTNENAEKEA
jgi:N6-adenosine-specific RNA methylase IME4